MSNAFQKSTKKALIGLSLVSVLGGTMIASAQGATPSKTSVPNGDGGTTPPETAPGGQASGMSAPGDSSSNIQSDTSKHAHKRAKHSSKTDTPNGNGGSSPVETMPTPNNTNSK
jgi:hypothetical protein